MLVNAKHGKKISVKIKEISGVHLVQEDDDQNNDNGISINENNSIFNQTSIKILGTIFSENSRFNEHVTKGTYSFINQIKRRASAIKRIAKYFDIKFKSQLVHSLLLGKIRYNVETWGNLNLELKYKINQVIVTTVEKITQNEWFGKSIAWRMKEMGIPTFYRIHWNSCYIQTYKILNFNKKNMLNAILTTNRSKILMSQNKCSSFLNDDMPSVRTKLSFEYIIREKYNKLPRQVTLSPNTKSFKKWLYRYNEHNEFLQYPLRKDNITESIHIVSLTLLNRCST